MSSSSDVRARRPHVTRPETAVGTAVLPELTPVAIDVTDAPPRHDPGYDRGFADGHAAAVAMAVSAATAEARDASAHAQQLAASLAGAVEAVRAHQAAELAGFAAEVTEAALVLAEALVGHALAGQVPAASAVARALALVPSGDAAVVRLHPDDVELVGAIERPGLQVVADAGIAPGGCVVDAGTATVDGSLAAAVERVRAALLEPGDEPW